MRRKQALLVTVLTAAAVASSFAVVVTRHQVRMEFMRSEALFEERDALQMRWESLQLEYGALRTEGRVEAIAKTELGMKTPGGDDVVTLMLEGGRQ